jgi:ABC-type taurine transport system ATPase subunit
MQEELHAVWRRTQMTVVFITHSVRRRSISAFRGRRHVGASGRILERLSLDYSQPAPARRHPTIKASPDFVATRERILGLIWATAG